MSWDQAWIAFVFVAAAAQTFRFLLQRQLNRSGLSVAGATFSRFMFSFPIIVIATGVAALLFGRAIPIPHWSFWSYALPGGICQILATACVIAMFSLRNFAVGIAFKKSEAVLTAFVSILILGEYIAPLAWIAIGLSVVAVLILSQTGADAYSWRAVKSPTTILGLTSGLLFAFSSVFYRGATLSLGEANVLLRAAVTLACVTAWQSLVLALWLGLREPGELSRVFAAWRVAAVVGITSLVGSYCWFTAFALQNAAYVKALGQIEVLFSIVATRFWLGEAIAGRELVGIAVLTVVDPVSGSDRVTLCRSGLCACLVALTEEWDVLRAVDRGQQLRHVIEHGTGDERKVELARPLQIDPGQIAQLIRGIGEIVGVGPKMRGVGKKEARVETAGRAGRCDGTEDEVQGRGIWAQI